MKCALDDAQHLPQGPVPISSNGSLNRHFLLCHFVALWRQSRTLGLEWYFIISAGAQRGQHIFTWNLKLGNGGRFRVKCQSQDGDAMRAQQDQGGGHLVTRRTMLWENWRMYFTCSRSHNETELGLSPVLSKPRQFPHEPAFVWCFIIPWQVYPVTSFDPHGNTNSKVSTDMLTIVYTESYTPSSSFCFSLEWWKHFKMSPFYTGDETDGTGP